MKKRILSIMAVLSLAVSLYCTGCGNNSANTNEPEESTQNKEKTDTSTEEHLEESTESESVQTEGTQNQVEYSLEDGKYQVSETFDAISEYDECIYSFFEYSDEREDGEIDDIDFLIEQMNKYKDRTKRCLSELDNYDEYVEIKECKGSLKKYREAVVKYADKIINDLPSKNDNKYVTDVYFDEVYPYRDASRNDVYYIWDVN